MDPESTSLRQEEEHERERHDELYAEELEAMGGHNPMQPWNWEKFDSVAAYRSAYFTSVYWLGDLAGKSVLDAGCGTGWFTVILAKRGAAHVDAFDISGEAVGAARERAVVNGCQDVCAFETGSFYEIPFPDATYDVVAGQAILHHLRDKQAACDELYRVMKPGGVAVFNEPYGESQLFERFRQRLPFASDTDDPDHWLDKVTLAQLEPFEGRFAIRTKTFELLHGFSRYVPLLLRPLQAMDALLLGGLPPLRRYARSIVIELKKL